MLKLLGIHRNQIPNLVLIVYTLPSRTFSWPQCHEVERVNWLPTLALAARSWLSHLRLNLRVDE